MKIYRKSVYLFAALILFSAINIFPQEKKQISIEWIYSAEPSSITRQPSVTWLKNGKAIMYSTKSQSGERVFEYFDPATQKSVLAFDISKALSSLKTFLGDKTPASLQFPVCFDDNAEHAVYQFDGTSYLLDFASSQFSKVIPLKGTEKNIHFSPNAKYLSYVRTNDIYIYDIAAKKEKRMTFDGSETTLNGTLSWVYWEEVFGRNDYAYWWSDDSKAIAYLQSDESKVGVIYFPDFQPATPRVIKQRYPKTGQVNPTVRAGIVEINSPKTKWVNFGTYKYEYLIRIGWLPGSKQVSLQTLNRDQDKVDLFLADRTNCSVKHILQDSDPGWINVNDDLYFFKNGKEFLWTSERTGYAHIYHYSIDGKLINAVTKGEWAVAASGGAAFWVRSSISTVDEANGIIYFTGNEKSPLEKHLYSVNIDGTGFKRLTTGDATHKIGFSADSKYYIDTYSDIHTPPVTALYKNDGTLVKIMGGYNKEKFAQLNLQTPEQFRIKARDGFPLPAEIMKPKDFDPNKKYPLIIYVYGGPSAPQVKNEWRSSVYYDQVLVDNGFLVAIIDGRASTGISKTLENLLLKQMVGPLEISELVDGVRWFKKQSYIDSTRIGIWGWSGGGSYTLNAMTNTKEFKAGIAVAGVTDWHFYDSRFAEMVMKTPEENPVGYSKTSLISAAKNLHGHLMIVHGTYDDNVHIQNAWAFINELIKANIKYELQVYPMRQHGIADIPARIHLYNTMVDFWKRNL